MLSLSRPGPPGIVVHARILVQRWRKSGILDLNSTMTSEPTEPPTEPPNETPTDLPTEVATTPASEPGFMHATQSSGLRRRVKHRVLQSSREPIDGV